MTTRSALVLAALFCGCAGTEDPLTDADPTDTVDTDPPPCEVEVPDPGDEVNVANWTSDDTNVSPETAWPVGTVEGRNDAPSYIQTILPSDEDSAYFVFRAGKDMNLPIHVQNSQNPFESMHLFDAAELCLGEEILQVNGDSGANFLDATFPVEEDQVYVLEIHVPGGGFF